MSSRISPNHSQRVQLYRGVDPSSRSESPERARRPAPDDDAEVHASAASSEVPDLGDDLSTDERKMIHDQFPPSPETMMRIYGRQGSGHQIQPGSLGSRLDLQG